MHVYLQISASDRVMLRKAPYKMVKYNRIHLDYSDSYSYDNN